MRKILFVCTTDSMIWNFLLPHIAHLKEQGYTVDGACSKTGFYFEEIQSKYKLKMYELPFHRSPYHMDNYRAYKQLQNLIKQEKYDLIHCHEPVGGAVARLAARKFSCKVLYIAHGFHFFKGASLFNNVIYKNVEKFLAHYTDILVTLNEEDFIAGSKFRLRKIGAVYQIDGIGVDLKKFELASNFDREQKKKSLSIPKDKKIIINVAEFIPRKNHENLIKAFAKANIHNAILLLCGVGELYDEMKELSKKLGISNKVIFLGFRKDINELLNIADIFCFPSYQEGLSIAGIEAMAAGLPLISSTARGVRDYTVENKNGFLIDPKDINAISEKMHILTDNEDLARDFALNSKKFVVKYDISSILKTLDQIYKKEGI